jgi:hypothetical protein
MIVYLGLPRCASSWIYEQLGCTEIKETHYLYTDPKDPITYCKNRSFDFSTNNWSMDSDVAQTIDPYVSKYILVIRNPVDLAISYKTMFNTSQSLDDFISTLIVNKLLCYGDIIDRWYKLVDPNKILIYNYNDIVADSQAFMTQLIEQLKLPIPTAINFDRINTSQHKKYEPMSNKNISTLIEQCSKFEKITNLPFKFAINT